MLQPTTSSSPTTNHHNSSSSNVSLRIHKFKNFFSCVGFCHDHLRVVITRISKFAYGSFIRIAYDWTPWSNSYHQYRSQNALTSASGASQAAPWVFQYYPTQSELFVPFLQSLRTLFSNFYMQNTQVLETKGIQKILVYRDTVCNWFRVIQADVDTSETLQTSISRSSLSGTGIQCRSVFLPLVQLFQQPHHQLIHYQRLHLP